MVGPLGQKAPYPMSWFIYSLRNYANFSGRANRREWWIFWFFCCLPSVLLIVLLESGERSVVSREFFATALIAMAIVAVVFWLGLLIPLFAVTVRRLHDVGLSGWWLLLVFVPILGAIFFLVVLLLGGNKGENAYGSRPPLHPSIPSKAPESFGEMLSKEVKHEQDTVDFVANLQDLVESNQSPDTLNVIQKDLLIRFYGHWFPKHRVSSRLKEYQGRYGIFLPIPIAICFIVLAIDWLLRTLFGWHPLGDSGALIFWSLLLTTYFVFAILSADLNADLKILKAAFAFLESKAQAKLKNSYAEHKSSGTASEFFVTEIYPALSKALKKPRRTKKRRSSDAEKDQANQLCIELAAAEVVKELAQQDKLSRI
jgi:uncharacterized membrane protein YhaH (DUF805 family)